MTQKKLRVVVLFGGRSGEYEVSLQSGAAVFSALDRQKYEVIPVGITRDGKWLEGIEPLKMIENDNTGAGAVLLGDPLTFVKTGVDVVFPVMHGTFGEDGTLQGLLEMCGLPYVGPGVLSSAVGMDKVLMKTVFAQTGIPQVRFQHCLRRDWEQNRDAILTEVEKNFTFPCFVKPANLGSSVGISKANNRQELEEAFELAIKYDRKIIIEEFMDGREIEVGVLGNDDPIVSVAGEIIPLKDFYDYESKYLDGNARLIAPAQLSPVTFKTLQELAIQAFKSIDCSGMARVDFFLARNNDEVLVNEINTIPGFTRFSMYPRLWELSGIGFQELLDRLIMLAIERHQEKSRLQTFK